MRESAGAYRTIAQRQSTGSTGWKLNTWLRVPRAERWHIHKTCLPKILRGDRLGAFHMIPPRAKPAGTISPLPRATRHRSKSFLRAILKGDQRHNTRAVKMAEPAVPMVSNVEVVAAYNWLPDECYPDEPSRTRGVIAVPGQRPLTV